MLQYKYSIVLYVTKIRGLLLRLSQKKKNKKQKKTLKAIDNWLSDLVEEPAL